MKKSLAVFLALVAMATSAAIQYPEEWHLWKAEHGVTYSVSDGVTVLHTHTHTASSLHHTAFNAAWLA